MTADAQNGAAGREARLAQSSEMLDVFWHDDCLKHDTGKGVFEGPASDLLAFQEPHPENAVRILNIKSVLERGPLAQSVCWHLGRHATVDELARFHHRDYIAFVREATRAGPISLDGAGTMVGSGSWEAALAAAGTGIMAVDRVLDGRGKIGYVLVRPPGHHAQPDKADGSCIFNNVGIAVYHALARGERRIAVIDWDQHHGNGTQEGFYADDRVLTVSIHMPHGRWGRNHPQFGAIDEVGAGNGIGYNLNVPIPFGAGNECYAEVMREVISPLIDEFAPTLFIAACGLDANQFDPNGRSLLTMDGFRTMARITRSWAKRYSDGRVILFQEGGYAPTYTAFCAHAVIEGILDIESGIADPAAYYDQGEAQRIPNLAALLPQWREYVATALCP